MQKSTGILVLAVSLGMGLILTPPCYSQTQQEMNATAEAQYEKADARLNKVYQKLMAQLDEKEKKKLIASERKWVAYRDAQAKQASDADEGGSIAPMDYATTALDLTQSRIKELEQQLAKK